MSTTALDYLVVGHVTRDLVEGGYHLGGTASYSPRAGRSLSLKVGVLTSVGPDVDLSGAFGGVMMAIRPAETTTTFENTYFDGIGAREQRVSAFAEVLQPAMVPSGWKPSVVHLGPIQRECSPELVDAFGDAFLGLTPQGWLRTWDREGKIRPCEWNSPERLLERADAVVLSEADVVEADSIDRYAALTRVLVVTTGAAGCVVYAGGARQEFRADPLPEVDPTGAGDIFATAFFNALHDTGDIAKAARFANCFARPSVTRIGLDGAPTRQEVDRCRRQLLA